MRVDSKIREVTSDAAPVCTVVPAQSGAIDRANSVAQDLGLRVEKSLSVASGVVALIVDQEDAWLQEINANKPGPVKVDFASPAMMHRRKGGQNEMLGRAIGIKSNRHPWVFDATAGLGRDSYVLADLGCNVTLVERSAVLAFVLQEGLNRAVISQFNAVREAAAGDLFYIVFVTTGIKKLYIMILYNRSYNIRTRGRQYSFSLFAPSSPPRLRNNTHPPRSPAPSTVK